MKNLFLVLAFYFLFNGFSTSVAENIPDKPGLYQVAAADKNSNPDISVYPGADIDLSKKSPAYRKGIAAFNKRDFKTAYALFLPIAKKGDADAQVNIGMMYLKGWHLKQDYGKARQWFLMAAEKGLAAAQQNMGLLYFKGLGVGQNYATAAKWYRMAADRGDMMAQYNLGVLYRDGKGIKQNLSEAVKWFTKSAKQTHVAATFNLGVMYRDGAGVRQDYKKAASLFRPVAEFGLSEAQFDLGLLYLMGRGFDKDYKEAEKWFRRAAKQGDRKAQYNLGVMYLKGIGVEKNSGLGTKLIEQAARNGHPKAQKVLEQLQAGLSPASSAVNKKYQANLRLCLIEPTQPKVKIKACTTLLTSGKLVKEAVPYAYFSRSTAYIQTGTLDKAIADLEKVISLMPQFPESYNTLAWVLATSKDAQYRNGKRALDLAMKAIALKNDPGFRDTLSAAYAEVGRFDDAVIEQDIAIEALRTTGNNDLLEDMKRRRRLYQQRKPYRE